MKLLICSKEVKTVKSTDEWRECAPPQNAKLHWQDYRSAKELAKSVFDNGTLVPLLESVLTRFDFPVPAEMLGYPEKATELPWGTRGNRKHDLLLEDEDKSLVIGIEAKADESFGDKVGNKRANSRKNADGGENMSKRLDGILNFLFGNTLPENKETLMYQLLSATAGVVLEAKNKHVNKACAMFLVFISDKLDPKKLESNEKAWKVFCNVMKIDERGGVVVIDGVQCLIVKEQIELKV